MLINFHPKAGTILICDFTGMIPPEICKTRPVVVISSPNTRRVGLATVVPLSTTRPHYIRHYHILLRYPPFPSARAESWAKCDLVMSVSYSRLARLQSNAHQLVLASVTAHDLKAIRLAAARSFGVDVHKQWP
jgi:uncharacterized protein YifN (PemK superfamily)